MSRTRKDHSRRKGLQLDYLSRTNTARELVHVNTQPELPGLLRCHLRIPTWKIFTGVSRQNRVLKTQLCRVRGYH